MTYHSAPWTSRFSAVMIDLTVFLGIFSIFSPDLFFLRNYPLAKIAIFIAPLYHFLYKYVCMVFFSKTLGMWFFGLEYFEVDENGNLIEKSLYQGINPLKALNRLIRGVISNLMLGIPYIELLYSLDGLHQLDRKSKVFIIGRVKTST